MVCVIICFASICSVCSIRLSTSASPSTREDGEEGIKLVIDFIFTEKEGDNTSRGHWQTPYLISSEGYKAETFISAKDFSLISTPAV